MTENARSFKRASPFELHFLLSLCTVGTDLILGWMGHAPIQPQFPVEKKPLCSAAWAEQSGTLKGFLTIDCCSPTIFFISSGSGRQSTLIFSIFIRCHILRYFTATYWYLFVFSDLLLNFVIYGTPILCFPLKKIGSPQYCRDENTACLS